MTLQLWLHAVTIFSLQGIAISNKAGAYPNEIRDLIARRRQYFLYFSVPQISFPLAPTPSRVSLSDAASRCAIESERQETVLEQRETGEISSAWAELAGLLVLAQNGDRTAYAALLQGLLPYLRRLAARRLARPQDVEDTVQDIFLSIHAIRHTYDPQRPLQPWVSVIAERRIADRLRRLYRQRAREAPLPEDANETFAADDANMTSEVSLDMRAVRRAIEQLPPGQRQAIGLVKVQGLSLREAAARTGQSEGAVKLSVHRAVKALRQLLGKEQSEADRNE